MSEMRAPLDVAGKRFALVAARWNEAFVEPLVRGAEDALLRLGAHRRDIDVIRVPGSFEVPQAALFAAKSGRYDAIIGLGVLIRGATLHFELIATEAARGLAAIPRETGIPAAFGIVTAETAEQATERCGGKMGNRGWDAALAAAEMVNVRRKILSSELRDDGSKGVAQPQSKDHGLPAPSRG
jgi:6,7-dimethyl-8-ribityllumazine synthase